MCCQFFETVFILMFFGEERICWAAAEMSSSGRELLSVWALWQSTTVFMSHCIFNIIQYILSVSEHIIWADSFCDRTNSIIQQRCFCLTQRLPAHGRFIAYSVVYSLVAIQTKINWRIFFWKIQSVARPSLSNVCWQIHLINNIPCKFNYSV